MLRYECEWCRHVKKAGERWILGFAAEYRSPFAKRVEFQLAPTWSNLAAQGPFAVHFCCIDHQQKYAAALLGAAPPRRRAPLRDQRPSSMLRTNTVAGISRQRPDQRIFPSPRTAQHIQTKSLSAKGSTENPRARRSRKRVSPRFTTADKAWARQLGIALHVPRQQRD